MQQVGSIPNCLVCAGHDPSGGAGLQADIEAISSMGAHAVTVVTAHTVQDTRQVTAVQPVDAQLVRDQVQQLMQDIEITAIKIGLLCSVEMVEAIAEILRACPDLPVVLDPVVRAGSGKQLQDDQTSAAMKALLFPHATVLTPNSIEARYLANNADSLDACAMSLLESGCEYVLLSGGHEPGDEITNRLYGNYRCLESFRWPRLLGQYHGTGCTLASALAGLLAHGQEPHSAAREAQEYTHAAIKAARQVGKGQLIPDRLYWARSSIRQEEA